MTTIVPKKRKRPPLVIKLCDRCGNSFAQRTYGTGRKYCSEECRYKKKPIA